MTPPTGPAGRHDGAAPWRGSPRETSSYAVVVPTVGRPGLAVLLSALDDGSGPRPEVVVVVDDRRPAATDEHLALPAEVRGAPVTTVRSTGRGPATARDLGWRHAERDCPGAAWIAFLDDDVVPDADWAERLAGDLRGLRPDIGGSQGRVRVPRPEGRRPTDGERNVIELERACWATADLAYRVDVLRCVGGFDRRFPRAYREDADLGLRVTEAGWTIVRGERQVAHPVGPATAWASVRAQRGNQDDRLMAALHGPQWRARCSAGPSRNGRHFLTAASGALALVAAAGRRRVLSLLATAAWATGTAELARDRITPGPRTWPEVATMLWTSAVIPAAATWHLVAGAARARKSLRLPGPCAEVRAVLFDRDGTLIVDVPYNGSPERVTPAPGAGTALRRLRSQGLMVGVVTNQSGVARGLLTPAQVDRINDRVEELLGPIDTWQACPHGPDDGCGCRKPAPGLIEQAAVALGVPTSACVVVGDIGADVEAARTAGARAILVPTPATSPGDVEAAAACGTVRVVRDLESAADRILGGLAHPGEGGT